MSKLKLWMGLSGVLFFINLLLLGFIYFNPSQHAHGEGPKKIIIEKLQFNEEQIEQYELLIADHRKSIRAADEEIRKVKNQLYMGLSDQEQSIKQDSLLQHLSLIHTRIEKIHLHHFQDIKALCSPEQMPEFEALSRELSSLFAKGPPHKKKP